MSREDDYKFIFTSKLHADLKEKVHGGVFCRVIDDRLTVGIDNDDLHFGIRFENFSEKIANGWTVTHAAYEVMKEYKKFINSKYFK